jgi:hypothetical protein
MVTWGRPHWISDFFITWFGYVMLRYSGQNIDLLRKVALAILILSGLFQVYFTVRKISLVRKIKKDPSLIEVIKNELVQHNELIAWSAAFFSVIGFIAVAAFVSIFVQINDLVLIFLTALLIGFGTHNAAFHVLER